MEKRIKCYSNDNAVTVLQTGDMLRMPRDGNFKNFQVTYN